MAGNNDFYRHLVENSLGLICAHDLRGFLLSVNAEAARLLEFEPGELIGRDLRELIDPQVEAFFVHYLQRVLRRGQASGELRLLKKSGSVVTLSYRNSLYQEQDSPPLVIGHAVDITRHLQMEEKLKESTERYRKLFDDAPVAYHEINREGLIARVNRAECQLLGWRREELLGRPVWDLISSGQKAASETQVKRKLSGEQSLAPFFREYVRKDGEKLTLLIHENLITSRAGEIEGIRTTLLDVTEQNRAESELRRVNLELDARIAERTKELEKSNRRLSEFVQMVSHDLREPVRSVSSFSFLLRRRYSDVLDSDGVELLDHVISSSGRMAGLIQDLLAYARTAEGEFSTTEVDLNDALTAALENLSEALQSNQAEIVRNELPKLSANFTQMMQLFQNLVDNALKYRSELNPVIRITARPANEGTIITVADNGIGIPVQERERVFQPFQRASNAACDGSGIGLAICQAIVERHRGQIYIEEQVGGNGATVAFRLPLAPG